MKGVFDWLDQRTGWRKILKDALFEHVPGGSRWRYVWGSTLTFALAVQFITGIFLWMAYSPSANNAWESVYYIQHEMTGGWFLRGLHHWTAQVMTVLLILHLMQVVIDGAYKAPREVNFWTGLILLQLVLAMSLTGYLLPWDQKGYWATKVATNIVGIVPLVGDDLQRLMVGGPDYGHQTLTRFFALHAGLLPALVITLIGGHIYLFRRHGVTPAKPKKNARDSYFWPEQVLKDAVACLAVLATVLGFVLYFHGAHLTAPANPAEPYNAARPDWYFLFLFEFLKWFPGTAEVWGAIIIPGLIMVVIFLIPFIAKWRLGHRFNLGLLTALLLGAGMLTWMAINADRSNPDYVVAVAQAEVDARRVVELAKAKGIDNAGAVALLRNDPLTQGPKIFAAKCAGCHRYGGHNGMGKELTEASSAPDLEGFASREWIAGLLNPETVDSAHYFGGTEFEKGSMVRFVKRKIPKYDEKEKQMLADAILALSAEAELPSQQAMDARDAERIEKGRKAIDLELGCADCHEFHFEDEDADGPRLTQYGSRDWMIRFVSNPAHPHFYGEENDGMPAFGKDQLLPAKDIELVVDWLRGDWYRAGENHPPTGTAGGE